jgi:hypothetical protein
VIWAVPVTDLSQTPFDSDGLALGSGGHVAVDQRVPKITRCRPELAEQVSREPSFGRFKNCAGMVSHEPAHQGVGVLSITKIEGTIERVETTMMQRRRVTNVVQPRGRRHGIGVKAKDRGQRPRRRRDSPGVLPAVRQRPFEESAGNRLRPVSVDH